MVSKNRVRIVRRTNKLGRTYYYNLNTKRFASKKAYRFLLGERKGERLRARGTKPKDIKSKVVKQPAIKDFDGTKRTSIRYVFTREQDVSPPKPSFIGAKALNGYHSLNDMAKASKLNNSRLKQMILNSIVKGFNVYGSLHYLVYNVIGRIGIDKYRGEEVISEYTLGGSFLEEELSLNEKLRLLYLIDR